jgi:hypothetical protein
MPKVNNRDRDILSRALREGGVSVVTHRHREALPEGIAALRHLHALCSDGLMRLDRVTGDKYDPTGEVRSDFKLTAKGERAASPGNAV